MDLNKDINSKSFNDYIVEQIILEGFTIKINLDHKDKKKVILNCEDFIGMKYLGKWEEELIKSIIVEETGDALVESIFKIKKNYDMPFNHSKTKNVYDKWYQVNINLKDGSIIQVACKRVFI